MGWKGTLTEELVLQDFKKANGEEWEYKDRRQEIVFIGHKMKGDVIQKLLDECLLTERRWLWGRRSGRRRWSISTPSGSPWRRLPASRWRRRRTWRETRAGQKRGKETTFQGFPRKRRQ